MQLDGELTCAEWAAASAAREQAWVDNCCAVLTAEGERSGAAAAAAAECGDSREATEAVACQHACSSAGQRLAAASTALRAALSSLADSRAALQMLDGEAQMAGGLSDLARLRMAATAALAFVAQKGPLAADGKVAPALRSRMWHVAAGAVQGAVVHQQLRAASEQAGSEAALAAVDAQAAAAADMLGQLAACLAASAGVELVTSGEWEGSTEE